MLAASFEYFESQKYCAVKIIKKIRLTISGKDQHQKNWYLIPLKRLFVEWVHSTIKYAYLPIFTSEQRIS